jgi:hypothetical protein
MNAVLEPITVKVVTRPKFNNTRLDSKLKWIHQNAAALARYWSQLANEEETEASDAELNRWLVCQWDIEVLRQDQRS